METNETPYTFLTDEMLKYSSAANHAVRRNVHEHVSHPQTAPGRMPGGFTYRGSFVYLDFFGNIFRDPVL